MTDSAPLSAPERRALLMLEQHDERMAKHAMAFRELLATMATKDPELFNAAATVLGFSSEADDQEAKIDAFLKQRRSH